MSSDCSQRSVATTTSHDVPTEPTAVMKEAEHVTGTTTNPTNITPTESNDPPPRTLLGYCQAVANKAAPTLSTLQNDTTTCTPLTTWTAERNHRREKLHTLSSVQEEHSHENSEDKTVSYLAQPTARGYIRAEDKTGSASFITVVASTGAASADMITFKTG